jgi:hypothetical protein
MCRGVGIPAGHTARLLFRPGGKGRQRPRLAALLPPARQPVLARLALAQEQGRRLGEGPLEVGVADLVPAGALLLAGRLVGAAHQPGVGQELVGGREAADVVYLVEQDQGQESVRSRADLARWSPPGYVRRMSAGPPLPAELWDSLPAEARTLILARRAEVAELRAKVREQQQHIEELHERLNENPPNSSRPPSTDPPTVNGNRPGATPRRWPGSPARCRARCRRSKRTQRPSW